MPGPDESPQPRFPLRTLFLCTIVAAIAFATLRSLGANAFLQLGVIVVGVIAEMYYWIDFIRRSNHFIKNG